MLNDNPSFEHVYIACGRTDLRQGIEGLSSLVRIKYELDPYQKNVLFLFCGTRSDRIKGLLWEGDGFLLLYKRLEKGTFKWPRTVEDLCNITSEQYSLLMKGFEVIPKNPIKEIDPPRYSF